jgi:hypothetical protein
MLSDAEAESERIRTEAQANATQLLAAGEEEAQRQEETIEIRHIEIAALDEEIMVRQKALRATAAELLRLADGIVDDAEIDLRDQAEPQAPAAAATAADEAETETDTGGSTSG